MNTKFTPGPWVECRGRIVGKDGEQIALHGFALTSGYTPKDDPSHANTALCKAAPRLYAVLEIIAAYPLEDFGFEEMARTKPLFGANQWVITVGDVLAARVALKKARGEA